MIISLIFENFWSFYDDVVRRDDSDILELTACKMHSLNLIKLKKGSRIPSESVDVNNILETSFGLLIYNTDIFIYATFQNSTSSFKSLFSKYELARQYSWPKTVIPDSFILFGWEPKNPKNCNDKVNNFFMIYIHSGFLETVSRW